eukprot:CAMPEP_0181232388 /NCGR_PEP_ID=MMETSP1096-20121128/35703_1 /TAXON_ID=156174 ORGANISM="Chrysochromulina ericina, Strain CCMP281" /NCGR_SAMPLE_ID=MMETSP1096 /ASSEMBLY_ACC=CAM_ASM_000453 /LENGTH=106 /DNA_ID=CAMNT_0023326673 /DNA_START=114 /DNA_END=434 /DNA_ORIENTATION=+
MSLSHARPMSGLCRWRPQQLSSRRPTRQRMAWGRRTKDRAGIRTGLSHSMMLCAQFLAGSQALPIGQPHSGPDHWGLWRQPCPRPTGERLEGLPLSVPRRHARIQQ